MEREICQLAEELFVPYECDNEEYNRIFKFVPAYKLAGSWKELPELEK